MTEDRHEHDRGKGHDEHDKGKGRGHDERPDEEKDCRHGGRRHHRGCGHADPKDERPKDEQPPTLPPPDLPPPTSTPDVPAPEPPISLPPPPARGRFVIQPGYARFGQQLVIVVRPDAPIPDIVGLCRDQIHHAMPEQRARPWPEVKTADCPLGLERLTPGHLMLDDDRVVVVIDPSLWPPGPYDVTTLLQNASEPHIDWSRVQRGRAWRDVFIG